MEPTLPTSNVLSESSTRLSSQLSSASHTPPPPPDDQNKLANLFKSRKALFVIVLIMAFGLVGTILVLRLKPPAKTATKPPELQDVSAEELKKFSDSLLKPTTNQTITINPNAHFDNGVTIDKILTAGAISTKALEITGPVSLDSANIKSNLFVGGGTTLQGTVEARNQLTVRGALTAANASFSGNLAVAGTLTAGALSVGDLTSKNLITNGDLTVNGHLALLGGAASAVPGPGAGNGSVRLEGNDTTGTIVISVGNAPVASEMAQIKFTRPYPGVPHVTITPIGQNAGALKWFANRAAGFLTIESLTAPLANTEYVFDYFVQR